MFIPADPDTRVDVILNWFPAGGRSRKSSACTGCAETLSSRIAMRRTTAARSSRETLLADRLTKMQTLAEALEWPWK
jgi:hypothetical protein